MKNYAQITIQGKAVGLKFGLPCIRHLHGKALSNENDTYTDYGISQILYGAYLNNCLVKETQEEFKFEDFFEYVEQVSLTEQSAELLEAIQTFGESQVVAFLADKARKAIASKKKEEQKSL